MRKVTLIGFVTAPVERLIPVLSKADGKVIKDLKVLEDVTEVVSLSPKEVMTSVAEVINENPSAKISGGFLFCMGRAYPILDPKDVKRAAVVIDEVVFDTKKQIASKFKKANLQYLGV